MLNRINKKKIICNRFFFKLFKNNISFKSLKILLEIGDIATKLGYNVYLVGGIVRDFYSYTSTNDIDIIVEGNAIQLAKILKKKKKFKVHIYKKFCTAKIKISKKRKIDIISSRREYYKNYFFLPSVEISSIKLDFKRRDFTINSLAIQLNINKFGILIDIFFSRKDIKNMILRPFHSVSFHEDPSRTLRILNIKCKIPFKVHKLTIDLLRKKYLKNLSFSLAKRTSTTT